MPTIANPVKEDFFQRIVNVNWPHEPECYWWTGTGTNISWQTVPNFTWFTSDDGIHFGGGAGGGSDDLDTVTQALWFRQRFDPRGTPVWVVGGHRGVPGVAQVNASFDGGYAMQRIKLEFEPSDVYFMHFMDPILEYVDEATGENVPATPAQAVCYTLKFGTFQCNRWTSTDGVTWHGTPGQFNIPIGSISTSNWPNGPNNIRQAGNTGTATGKIKNGPKARMELKQKDSHSFLDGITVTTDDGESWVTSCGLETIMGIVYGHNVFACSGAFGEGAGGIVVTEDGKIWYDSIAGNVDGLIMAMACGPRR
jgi:hypothetical protein